MKITELENEAALDLLADILEPATVVFSDPKVKAFYTDGGSKIEIITYLVKNHQKPIIEILAALDGVPVNEYHANILKMTKQLLELMNDKELMTFFTSAEPMKDQKLSGSATENTEGNGK